jgi:hypothetical protein
MTSPTMMICSRCGGLASLAGEPLLCDRCRAAMPALAADARVAPPPRTESAAETPWRAPGAFPFRGLGAGLGITVSTFLLVAGFAMFMRSLGMGGVADLGRAVLFLAVALVGYSLAVGMLNDRRGATLAHAIVHTILGALFLIGLVAALADGESGIAAAFALLLTGSAFAAGFTYTAHAVTPRDTSRAGS